MILRERERHPFTKGDEGEREKRREEIAATGRSLNNCIFIMPPEMELLIKYEKDMFLDCFSSLQLCGCENFPLPAFSHAKWLVKIVSG